MVHVKGLTLFSRPPLSGFIHIIPPAERSWPHVPKMRKDSLAASAFSGSILAPKISSFYLQGGGINHVTSQKKRNTFLTFRCSHTHSEMGTQLLHMILSWRQQNTAQKIPLPFPPILPHLLDVQKCTFFSAWKSSLLLCFLLYMIWKGHRKATDVSNEHVPVVVLMHKISSKWNDDYNGPIFWIKA